VHTEQPDEVPFACHAHVLVGRRLYVSEIASGLLTGTLLSPPDMHLFSLTMCHDHEGPGYCSLDVYLSDIPSLATTVLY